MPTSPTTQPLTSIIARPLSPFLDDLPMGEPGRLAIFGKHPAAADHLEDIGLASSSLVAFKQGFYLDGITECLTRQTWLKDLGATDSVPYDHSLLTVGRRGWMAVRFQHSADAPGRRQFPLVLALHGANFSALNGIAGIGQMMDGVLASAAAARDPAALKQVHAQGQARLQELLRTEVSSPAPGPTAREAWLQGLGLGPDNQGLWRTCHALSAKGAGVASARVPLHLGGPWQSGTLWLSLVRRLFDLQSEVLTLVWKQRQAFGDLALSPPGSRVLAGLFAPEAGQPQTASIPFNFSPELKAQAQAVLKEWLTEPELFPPQKAVEETPSLLNKVCNGLRGWFKPSEQERKQPAN